MVLGLASCQTEPEGLDVNVGGVVDTVVTVNIPENETRANNSGIGVFENGILESDDYTMRYIFQVYYRAEDNTVTKSTERQVKYTDGTSVTFPVRLIPGRDYQFVVWADVVTSEDDTDNHYNTTNLEAVSVIESSWKAMDETRDAFTASYAADDYNGSQSINIDLYRPFAKLRVIATDYDELAKIGIKVEKAAVNYTTVHRSTFNAYTSKAVETDVASIDKDHSTYEIATYAYETGDEHTIFSDYFFAENDVVKFEITVYDQNDAEIVTRALTTDIYAKRNYLTTIKGDILTDGNNVNVEVKPGFGKPDVEVDGDIKDELTEAAKNKHYVINLEGDFIWETGAGHGSNPLIPADAITETLTINGNGYKFIATGTGVGAIRLANGGKLILNDLTVVDQSEYHAERGETAWEFTYLEFAGETEFNNCVIDNTVALDGAKAVFNDCTFNDKVTWPSNAGQEYAAWVSNGIVHFNNCDINGDRGIKVHEAYGTEVEEVLVNESRFNNLSKKPGMAIGTVNAATKIEIKNSTFTNCQPGDQGLYMYETDTDVTIFNFSQTNNTVNATVATNEAFATILKADIHTLNIALAADVTVDVSAHVESYYFGGNNTNVITIDGAKVATAAATGANDNAYTLTFNHKNSDWNYIRFNNDNAKWVIKNVKLTNSGYNNGPWNRHDIRFYNDVVLENVTSDKAIALLADADLTNVVISDVHPDNSEAYALWITAEGQTVNIKDCALLAHESKNTDRGIKIEHQYIDAPAKVTLNIDGLKVKSQKKAAIMVNSKAGADITLQNVDLSEVAEDKDNAVWVDSNTKQYAGLVTVTGGSKDVEGLDPIEGETTEDIQATLNAAVTTENATVQLPAGEYKIPENIATGVTIVCDEGVVFTSKNLNINGATISGATFENGGNAATGTVNGTFLGCTFNGSNGLRNCYIPADKELLFEGCVFYGDTYGVHFDGGNNTGHIVFKNCDFTGWNSFASTVAKVEFYNCNFHKSGYGKLRFYQDGVMDQCVFDNGCNIDFGDTGNTVYFTNCSSKAHEEFAQNIRRGDIKDNTLYVDGKKLLDHGLYLVNENEYEISSKAGLEYFSNVTAANGTVIKLAADIDMEGAEFKAIAAGYDKSLTFDGQNHTIKNVQIATCSHNSVGAAGLFFCYTGGTLNVSNLVVEKATSVGATYAGVITGYTQGNATLTNITVKECNISGAKKIGGIAGFVEASTTNFVAENCKVIDTTVAATEKQAGTIIGYNAKPATLKNCTVENSTATAPQYCDGGVRSTDPAQAELTIE